MFKLEPIKKMNEEERLKYMNILLKGQLSSEKDNLANISNATAIINACIDNINWAGFYFLKEDELVLGPFQGLPACNRIAVGKGVCGTAVSTREVQLVPDVHLFPGHIACDSASNSEVVIPLTKNGIKIGVMDLDSPKLGRFTEDDQAELEQFAAILLKHIDIK